LSLEKLEEVKRRYLGPASHEIYHDGFGEGDFEGFTQDENAILEKLFLEKLSFRDTRPIKGLGYLRSIKAADSLKKMLESAPGNAFGLRIDLAHALWRIEGYPEAKAIVLNALQNGPNKFIRIDAISALWDFQDAEVIEKLISYLNDSEYLVRYNVGRALIQLMGDMPKDTAGQLKVSSELAIQNPEKIKAVVENITRRVRDYLSRTGKTKE
jgi:hypothetical protein